jgi:hypothetical protein
MTSSTEDAVAARAIHRSSVDATSVSNLYALKNAERFSAGALKVAARALTLREGPRDLGCGTRRAMLKAWAKQRVQPGRTMRLALADRTVRMRSRLNLLRTHCGRARS